MTLYPFDQYKIVYKKNTRDRLSHEELVKVQRYYNDAYLPDHLQTTLHYFLFACYTGLSWGDLESLKYEDIEQKGNAFLISSTRNKTDIDFVVPLLEEAKKLIDLK